VPANRATPIPLTKRKERHRTLPFGPQPPPPDPRGEAVVEVDEEATTGQHRTQPYAESAVVAAAQAHAHGTPLPREGE
jgi:hypothetical protein